MSSNLISNSTNNIDLMYLTNAGHLSKSPKDLNIVDKKEVEFYKKRIFQLCKDLLRGKKENSSINDAFDTFCLTAIEHFKMVDKADLIQNEYKDLNISSTNSRPQQSVKPFHENPDELMFKKIEKNNDNTMDKFIIKNVIKKEESIILPTQKTYNLKDVKYQEKNVEVKSKSSAVAIKNKKKKNKKVLKEKEGKSKKKEKLKKNIKKEKSKNVIDLNIN